MTSTSGWRSVGVRPLADAVGVAGSLLCAMHCLLVPVALLIGPIGRVPHTDDEAFHHLLLWMVVPAAAVAFGVGCLEHKDRWVLGLGAVGLATMTAAFTLLHDAIGASGERIAAMLASGLLITAHVRNFQLCRSGACRHDRVRDAGS